MSIQRVGVVVFAAGALWVPLGAGAATLGRGSAVTPLDLATHVIQFAAAAHSASFVAGQPSMSRGAKGIEVIISSPRSLQRGPVRYEGGYKQQKLAATIFLYNTSHDLFRAGLALNAGSGVGCTVRVREEICRTAVGKGFIDYQRHRWKRLKITLFKPAHEAAAVRVVLRTE